MPFETLAAFVTEQALGIAIGAIAVAAAPAVMPELRALGQDVASGANSASEKAGKIGGRVAAASRDAGGAVASKLASGAIIPGAQAGHKIYRGVTSGVRWYGGQWADLVAEANASQTSQAAATSITYATVLASLPRARVLSNIPGRVRLRVSGLRSHRQLAAETIEALVTVPGVRHVYISSQTGSLLIHYDRSRYGSLGSLLSAIAAW